MVPSLTSTVTPAGSTEAGAADLVAGAVLPAGSPVMVWKNAATCAGSVASASVLVEGSGPVVGRVVKVMFPAARLVSCSATVSTERSLSKTTDRLTAVTRSRSAAGSVRVPTDRILLAALRDLVTAVN